MAWCGMWLGHGLWLGVKMVWALRVAWCVTWYGHGLWDSGESVRHGVGHGVDMTCDSV